MKKVMTALLAASALVTLAACGGNSDDTALVTALRPRR